MTLPTERKRPERLIRQSERHRKLHQVPELGLTLDIHSKNELCFIRLVTTESSIFLVNEGEMQIETPDVTLTARQGEFLLLQAGEPLKITHRPAENGQHSARGVLLDSKMVVDAAPSPEACFTQPALYWKGDNGGFAASFGQAYCALQNAGNLPPAVVDHRLRELFIWLAQKSVFFRPIETTSLSARLRKLLAKSPGDAWPEKQVAGILGQSQATLRRRLAAESTSYRAILSETRMLHALRLLHSTDDSIGNIARHSGYACQSRFAQCFHKRFGFYPSTIRGHRREKIRDKTLNVPQQTAQGAV